MELPYPQLDWKQTSWPGVRLAFLESYEDGGARVVIAMDPGCSYPEHRHLGEEQVFVIRGSYFTEKAEHIAGSFQRWPAGSRHHPVAGEQGAILLASAEKGIELLGSRD